jgi:hypothetical protein
VRSASGEHRRISVCARVFHRKQGTQYRAAQSRASERLDAQRISPRLGSG